MKKQVFKIRYSEIAKLAGVSKSTVSRVFNHPNKVSENTKKVVYDVVNRLNFRPNMIARSLRVDKTNTIGIIIPDITNSFFSELVKGVQTEGHKNSYTVLIGNSFENVEMENETVYSFLSRKVDGLIIVTTSSYPSYLKDLFVPTIFVDRLINNITFPQITSNNKKGGYLGMKHLLFEKNRKKILIVHGPLKFSNIPRRLEGCKQAFEEYNRLNSADREIAKMETLELSTVSVRAGEYAGDHILKNFTDFDAIFALSDLIAIGILKKIKRYRKIGKEISILGYDDIKEDKYVEPELSSVKQEKSAMGKRAFNLFMSVLKGEKLGNSNIILPVEVMKRRSS